MTNEKLGQEKNKLLKFAVCDGNAPLDFNLDNYNEILSKGYKYGFNFHYDNLYVNGIEIYDSNSAYTPLITDDSNSACLPSPIQKKD